MLHVQYRNSCQKSTTDPAVIRGRITKAGRTEPVSGRLGNVWRPRKLVIVRRALRCEDSAHSALLSSWTGEQCTGADWNYLDISGEICGKKLGRCKAWKHSSMNTTEISVFQTVFNGLVTKAFLRSFFRTALNKIVQIWSAEPYRSLAWRHVRLLHQPSPLSRQNFKKQDRKRYLPKAEIEIIHNLSNEVVLSDKEMVENRLQPD